MSAEPYLKQSARSECQQNFLFKGHDDKPLTSHRGELGLKESFQRTEIASRLSGTKDPRQLFSPLTGQIKSIKL